MNKNLILEQFVKEEDKILVAKLLDKIEVCNKTRKIQFTDFLDIYQISILEKVLKSNKISYRIFGGFNGASKNKIIIYNENIETFILDKVCKEAFVIVRILLPKQLHGEYLHRNYLSAIIKLGVKREKIGDIVCDDTGADIITTLEIAKFLNTELTQLKRFQKSNISIIQDINEIKKIQINKKELKIITSSLRLDNIIAELLKTSRRLANDIIENGKVFINYQNELKSSKLLNEKDIVVIRGKGKFEFNKIEGNTKKDRFILLFNKYI